MAETGTLRKIAEGREAEMFAWENGRVLRLLRDAGGGQRLERDAAAIEAAREAGVPVPAVFGRAGALGRPGLIMERIDGPDLLSLISRQPWRLFPGARACGELHARMHLASAPETLTPLKTRLRGALLSPLVPPELGGPAVQRLAPLPEGDALCHGDFHPANVLMGRRGPVVIDWSNACRGDPDADVARTLLILRLGEPPENYGLPIKLMAKFGRSILIWGYLRAYRRLRPLDIPRVEAWAFPLAVARLAEDIAEERERLLRLLRAQVSATPGA